MQDIPYSEIIRKNCEDEMQIFNSDLIGKGETAVIPLKEDITMIYSSGVPAQSYRLLYSHYYYDKIMLCICLTGQVQHDNGEWLHTKIGNGQSFMYGMERDRTFVQMEKGKKYEQVSLVFGKKNFYECLDRFFDEFSKEERQICIDAFFSKNTTGKLFDISKEVRVICRQILNCRLTGNYRRVFLECKLFEILAYYFQSITQTPTKQLVFSSDEIAKLQQAKKLLNEQTQILNFTVDQLCREVGLNRFKLNLGFKSIFNTSIIKFYRSAVLAKAHNVLLSEKGKSIEETALNYGYGSVQAFSNAFFKEYGYRPSRLKG